MTYVPLPRKDTEAGVFSAVQAEHKEREATTKPTRQPDEGRSNSAGGRSAAVAKVLGAAE